MILPSKVRDMFAGVYATVYRGSEAETRATELHSTAEGYAIYGRSDWAVLFVGDALRGVEKIVDALAGSALADGGFAADSLRRMIASACRAATVEDAIAQLAEVLASKETSYTFAEPLRVHLTGDGPALLGRCLVHKSIAGVAAPISSLIADAFPARAIAVTVTARDEPSAYMRALDAIDEAKAILLLVDDRRREGDRRGPIVTTSPSLKGPAWTLGGEGFVGAAAANELLTWPYHGLSTAARKPDIERSELEVRALGATRWHYEAATTSWPTSALTAAMSALETLLLPPGIKKGKGSRLAVTLRDLSQTQWAPAGVKFTGWFVELYDRRNDATHQGVSYEFDANVRRLLGLTHSAIDWACTHLFDYHASTHDGTACTTLEEALAEHL